MTTTATTTAARAAAAKASARSMIRSGMTAMSSAKVRATPAAAPACESTRRCSDALRAIHPARRRSRHCLHPRPAPALRLRRAASLPVRRADAAQQRHLRPAPVRQVRHGGRPRQAPVPCSRRAPRRTAGQPAGAILMSFWRAAFLAEHYGRLTLSIEEVADQIGLAAGTIKNRRLSGEFGWIRSDGRQLCADVADVAAYLEQRRTAHAEIQSSPPHTASSSPSKRDPSRPGARRRRTPSPAESC